MTPRAKPKRGVETDNLDGLRDVKPVWDHELDHVRSVMTSEAAAGYRFAILRSTGRVSRLYDNMDLSARLFSRLYNGKSKTAPTPRAHNAPSPSWPTPQDGGAIVVCDQSHTPAYLAPRKRRKKRTRTDAQRQVFEAIAGLSQDMGAKKISQVLESQGLMVPMSTVKRYMREARQ